MIVALSSAVQTRLKTLVTGLHQRVQLAVDLAAVFEKGAMPHQMPAAYVIWAGDRPKPNTGANYLNQEVTTVASVVLIGRSAGELVGTRSAEDLGVIGDTVIAALVGWQPDGMDAPLEYAGGNLIGIRQGAVFIDLKFSTRWNLRVV